MDQGVTSDGVGRVWEEGDWVVCVGLIDGESEVSEAFNNYNIMIPL